MVPGAFSYKNMYLEELVGRGRHQAADVRCDVVEVRHEVAVHELVGHLLLRNAAHLTGCLTG